MIDAWRGITTSLCRSSSCRLPGAQLEAGRPNKTENVVCNQAIESLNFQLRKVTKTRGSFLNEEAALKVLYLAILRATERWTRPLNDWRSALNIFTIMFEGRAPQRL
ncbi:transposase [Deinococcus peraridilitoris]|uniref:transposase n=1 Tax=Deinococcus peraridilitoris TaxID=432329 RepID=UPI0012FA2F06|nr:transposase [Deinococcus peraridilitoris]